MENQSSFFFFFFSLWESFFLLIHKSCGICKYHFFLCSFGPRIMPRYCIGMFMVICLGSTIRLLLIITACWLTCVLAILPSYYFCNSASKTVLLIRESIRNNFFFYPKNRIRSVVCLLSTKSTCEIKLGILFFNQQNKLSK